MLFTVKAAVVYKYIIQYFLGKLHVYANCVKIQIMRFAYNLQKVCFIFSAIRSSTSKSSIIVFLYAFEIYLMEYEVILDIRFIVLI